MTEADFEREAVKLFQQLGLTVGAESLDFFQGESLFLTDWKNNFKHSQSKYRHSSPFRMSSSALSSNPDRQTKVPLTVHRPNSDIGSEGSVSASPTSYESTDREEDEIIEKKLENAEDFGACSMCDQPVIGEETGCLALDEIFHNACFKCNKCYKVLSGNSFFVKNGLILCEKDYLLTLDKCYICQQIITDKIIRAIGHTYHPVCFRCSECGLCLDGVPFATDFNNRVYCEKDFHKMFAPRCAACQHPIVPLPGNKKSRRLIAMNLSFHVECYRCSECDIPLATDSEESGSQCYPIDDNPLCLDCNKLWSTRGQTSLTFNSAVSS